MQVSDMLFSPDELPDILSNTDPGRVDAVKKWCLDVFHAYPGKGTPLEVITEVCAACFFMGHFVGYIECHERAKS